MISDKNGNNVTELMQARTPNGTLVLAAATSAKVMDLNPDRRFTAIVNSGANPVYLTLMNPAVVGQGVYLAAGGGVWTFGASTDFDYRGEVYGISSAGTILSFIEQ